MNNHVILCGFGKVGQKVLETLVRLNDSVLIVEQADSPALNTARARKIPYIIGDIRDFDTLKKAGIERSKGVILCTDDDLANLEGALSAREIYPESRIILRIYDEKLSAKIEKGFGFDFVFSTSTIAAPTFAYCVHVDKVISSTIIEGELFITTKIRIKSPSRLDGIKIGELKRKTGLAPLFLVRNDGEKIKIPDDTIILQVGDELAFSIANEDYDKVKFLQKSS